ncbi:smoothelin-like protein 1 [Rhynchocyon petersi]
MPAALAGLGLPVVKQVRVQFYPFEKHVEPSEFFFQVVSSEKVHQYLQMHKMEQNEEKPLVEETHTSPPTEDRGTRRNGTSADQEANDTAGETVKEGSPDGAGKLENSPAEEVISAELQGEANGLDEVKVESKGTDTAECKKEDGVKEEPTGVAQEKTDVEGEAKSELKEVEGAKSASEKQKTEEKEDKPASREEADVDDQAKAEGRQACGEEAKADPEKTDGEEAAMRAPQAESANIEEPEARAEEQAGVKEAEIEPQQKAVVNDAAKAGLEEADGKEEVKNDAKKEEPGGANEDKDQDVEREPEEGASMVPSSPDEWPESPTEEGHGLSPDEVGPDTEASGETSPSASESSPSDVPQSPTETSPPGKEKKEKAPERRVSAPARPRGVRAQNRKAIVDKFGGAASGPTALFRNTKAAGVAIGGVKQMLLEWCRAMTKKYEHVDIQNFSSSWSSGMAFCALIHKFFPDAFDYAALDPTQRRHNFTLAFSTAEKLADCAQLLDVDDMVRLAVPDSKCVYTYIQELYRSLVEKGLVKTKKK